MAELTNNPGANSGRVRRLKKSPRVDLTAMVDLAFLLITFFMLTTTLAKPQAMDLNMPDKNEETNLPVSEERTVTICLGKEDRLQWYKGTFAKPVIAPSSTNYAVSGIRQTLLEQSDLIKKQTGKGMIVLIKPSDKSNYENLVDILDEMKITKVASYAIVDISKEELGMMRKNGLY